MKTVLRKFAAALLAIGGGVGMIGLLINQLSDSPMSPPWPMIMFGLCIVLVGIGIWWFRRPVPVVEPPVVSATEDQIRTIKRLAKQIFDRFGGSDRKRWDELLVLGQGQGVTCDGVCLYVKYIHLYQLRVYFKNDTINKEIKKGAVTYRKWPEGFDVTLEHFHAQQIIFSLEAVIAAMNRPTITLS